MSDGAAAAAPKKKLPFKPTALRKAAPELKPTDSVKNGKRKEGSDDEDDDGLGLFRQSREMESIVAAERARKLRKKQKQAEERRLSDAVGRQLLDSDEDGLPSLTVAAEASRATLVDESLTMDEDSVRWITLLLSANVQLLTISQQEISYASFFETLER